MDEICEALYIQILADGIGGEDRLASQNKFQCVALVVLKSDMIILPQPIVERLNEPMKASHLQVQDTSTVHLKTFTPLPRVQALIIHFPPSTSFRNPCSLHQDLWHLHSKGVGCRSAGRVPQEGMLGRWRWPDSCPSHGPARLLPQRDRLLSAAT